MGVTYPTGTVFRFIGDKFLSLLTQTGYSEVNLVTLEGYQDAWNTGANRYGEAVKVARVTEVPADVITQLFESDKWEAVGQFEEVFIQRSQVYLDTLKERSVVNE